MAVSKWKGNVEQMAFEGTVDCDTFAPHPLRANFCTNCFKQIARHRADAIQDEAHIVKALEYGQKGERTPSAIFAPTGDADAGGGAGGLFLGGFKAVMNEKFLRSARVTAVVNCAKGLEIFGPVYLRAVARAKASGIKFLELGWVDASDQAVPREDLARAAAVIAAARAEGGSVIVHCAQGKSRSTTVVLAYVIALRRQLEQQQQQQGETEEDGDDGGGGGGGSGDELPPLVPFHRRRSVVAGASQEQQVVAAQQQQQQEQQEQSSTAAAKAAAPKKKEAKAVAQAAVPPSGEWDFVRDGPCGKAATLVDAALAWVRTRRQMAQPNDGFMQQLRALEKDAFFDGLLSFLTPPRLEDLF